MRTDHDSGYKQLFAHPELVCELLALCWPDLPGWAVAPPDPAVCERISSSYTSEGGHQRHGDMVWLVRSGLAAAEFFALLEFQSTPDRWMALRMHVYGGMLCQELLKQGAVARDGPLPVLLPVVVYTGAAAWHAEQQLSGMWPALPAPWLGYQLEQRYVLLDLPAHLATGASGIIASLFECSALGAPKRLLPALDRIVAWLELHPGEALHRTVTRWVLAHLRRRFEGINIFAVTTLEEVVTMQTPVYETFYQALMREARNEAEMEGLFDGLQEGLQKGWQEGRQEGRAEVLKDVLLRVMGNGQGPMPPAAAARVEQATERQLQDWLDQALKGQRPSGLLDS